MRFASYDIAVLGCGPAGLSAAINAVIRNKRVIVLGSDLCSPPMHKAQKIDNYLGFPNIKGGDLLEKFLNHAQSMNIEMVNSKAVMINRSEEGFNILVNNEIVNARAVIIATGIPYKQTLPNENRYLGNGLGYCATCDGPLYRNKDVIIIGHDEEAESEANFMAEICRQVYYLPVYKTEVKLDRRIKVLKGKAREIVGEEVVEGLKLNDGTIIKAEGLFIIGAETAPERLLPGLEMDGKHIKVNRQQETNLVGVYAAGDCTGQPYQVAKSVGEGQIAGLNASRYVSKK